MISRRELKQEAMRQGVVLGVLEKDYALTVVLDRIYAEPAWRETLVVKGGTALHKVYLGRRLSLDLDFTAQRLISLEAIRSTLEIPELQGQVEDVHEYHDALKIDRLSLVGPLQHPTSIEVDISFCESTSGATPEDSDDALRPVIQRDLPGPGGDPGREGPGYAHAPRAARLF